jgi:hypothetical protein
VVAGLFVEEDIGAVERLGGAEDPWDCIAGFHGLLDKVFGVDASMCPFLCFSLCFEQLDSDLSKAVCGVIELLYVLPEVCVADGGGGCLLLVEGCHLLAAFIANRSLLICGLLL